MQKKTSKLVIIHNITTVFIIMYRLHSLPEYRNNIDINIKPSQGIKPKILTIKGTFAGLKLSTVNSSIYSCRTTSYWFRTTYQSTIYSLHNHTITRRIRWFITSKNVYTFHVI